MKYKGEFKTIDTEQKAYFLGFAYADGCISKKRGKGSVFRMSLADKDIIYQLQNLFPFFDMDTFDYSKYNKNHSRQYAIRKVSTELYNDLVLNGLLEQKSGENSENIKLPLLKEYLWRHFIRGYFDGDGSINISKKRPNLRRIEICSSSKTFLSQLKWLIEAHGINCPIFREKYNNKSPLYVLEWVNSKDVIDLREFLYKDATLYLNRKKEKFDSFSIIDKKDNNPTCICGGPSFKRGSRQMKHGLVFRFKCTRCGLGFSQNQAQVKQGELLETPTLERQKEDNQQPSLSSNTFEGSTTNSRVQKDSNADTSALPETISIIEVGKPYSDYLHNKCFGDDIV